jgi:hypothetical protein
MPTSQPLCLGRTSSNKLAFGSLSSSHRNTLSIKSTISRDQSIHNRELQKVLRTQLRNRIEHTLSEGRLKIRKNSAGLATIKPESQVKLRNDKGRVQIVSCDCLIC